MSEPVREFSASPPDTGTHVRSPLPLVLVVGRTIELRIRVSAALMNVATVEHARTVRAARAALLRTPFHAMLVEATDATGASSAPLVEDTRKLFPRTAVLACVPGRSVLTTESLSLIRAGAHDVLVMDDLDLRHTVRGVVAAARLSCLTDAVWPTIGPLLDPVLAPCMRLALRSSIRPLDVDGIAGSLGIHRKTLWQRCQQRRLPPPRALLGWCRVLAVAFALEDQGRSVDSIAVELEFPSPSALRNMIQRYVGITPSELRARGASRYAAEQLSAVLRPGGNREVA